MFDRISFTDESPRNIMYKMKKNRVEMSLHVLIALITLSSTSEYTPSVTSLPVSNCGESYFQYDYFNMTESILSLEHMDLTVLIIWEGQTQLSFPQLYFFDFESRSFSRKSLTFKDWSESIFGQVLSHGNERIYIPWADGDSGDVSRSFFESHLLRSVKNFRVIVMFDPELSDMEMSADSKLSLTRVFSLLNGTYEVHLVLGEDPGYTTIKFYNFTHHSAYLKEVFNSCSNCAEYYIRRWIVNINQVNKNFPAIQYENVSVKTADSIFSEWGFIPGHEQKQELEKITCHLLRTFADVVWETDDYTQFDFSDWGGIHNLTEKVILTLKNDSLQFKTYNQTPVLKKPSEKLFSAPRTQYKQIKPEKKIKTLERPQSEGDIFQDIKQMLELYPKEAGSIGDLLPEKDEEYYEYKLDGSLQGIFLLSSAKEKKKLPTGIHNMEDLDGEEYVIPNAAVTCLGDLMIITGVNVTLNVQTKDCPFRMLIVKASTKVELTRNFYMPGVNLFIYSPIVKSVGSHVINLSGEDCLEDLSGGDGGNFTIYMDKYEGKPLKVISNGGKGCNKHSKDTGSDPVEITHEVFGANNKNLSRESYLIERGGTNGKRGRITVFSTDPNYDVFGETSNVNINGSTTWNNLADGSGGAKSDFLAYLSEREKIQIFIGHVIDDKSLDGSRIIDQVYILSNYARSPGYYTEEHGMYDPFGEPIASNTSSDLKWLAMNIDASNFNPTQRSGNRSSGDGCYPLTINNYEIECAIDLVNRKVSDLSCEVVKKLTSFSIRVINCSQIDLRFVSEFDIVLCKVSAYENSHIKYPFLVDEELTCYQTQGETVVCHCKRNDSNFDEITELAKDFAIAILTARHIQVNPLQMIHAPLTDFTPGSGDLEGLNEIFRETYTSLVRDLQIFYEEVVKPKAEMALIETARNLFDSRRNAFARPGVADTLSWNLFIKTEILGCAPERFHFPKMLAELALPSSNTGSLQLLQNLREKTTTARITAIALYLGLVKSQVKREGLPAQLKNNVSAILEEFSKTIKDLTGANAGEHGYNWSEREINLTLVSSLTTDIRENFSRLEAGLPREILEFYRGTIGKIVDKQDKMLDVIHGIMSVAKDKNELETALPHAFEVAEKTNKTFQSFDIYFELIRAFENAISDPDRYLNVLYVKILKNLNYERNYLIQLSESNSEIADLKSALGTAFDLELEVYRALQTVRRVEDIRSTYGKITNSSEGFGSNANAIGLMYNILEDSIASFLFKTVQNDFEYRIFPFYEDVTPSFRAENLGASIKELETKEKKYRKYFKHASFDPGTCNNSCQPFYVWSNRDIRRQGQDIQSLFQGGPLFLFADLKNGFPGTVKSKNFRIRFVSEVAELEERVKGTGILLQPATFAYISFRNEIYFSNIEDTYFEHVLGKPSLDPSNEGSSLISPYTLWRIQLMNVSRDFDKAVNFVGGIELVGEGEIVADDTDRPDYVKTSKPEEWESEDVYLTLLLSRY